MESFAARDNAIESRVKSVVANLKDRDMRQAAARSIPALAEAIATAIDAVTPKACASYFANAGYKPA